MKVAPGFVGEALEKLTGQTEAERARHVLSFLSLTDASVGKRIQPPPHQEGPSAEINDAPRQAFIHRYIHLARKRVARVEPHPIAADASLIPQRLGKSLSQDNPAVFHRVVRIDLKVPLAIELQIDHGVPGEQRQHVVEEGNASPDGRFARPVDVQLHCDARFFGYAVQLCPSSLHFGAFNQMHPPNTKPKPFRKTQSVLEYPVPDSLTDGCL